MSRQAMIQIMKERIDADAKLERTPPPNYIYINKVIYEYLINNKPLYLDDLLDSICNTYKDIKHSRIIPAIFNYSPGCPLNKFAKERGYKLARRDGRITIINLMTNEEIPL